MQSPAAGGPPSIRTVSSWLLFDFAAQPFYTLIVSYVFAPFFAAVLVGDPVRGQALWGYLAAGAGLVISVIAPVAGAIADAGGRQKRGVALFSVLLVAGTAGLWFCAPGAPHAVALALLLYGVALIGAEGATAFTNAMMRRIVADRQLGRLSGTGVAVGNVGGIVSLAIVLGFLVAERESGLTMLGLPPVFGLSAVAHAGERAVGPFVALWYVVFVIPLFLFVPDLPGRRALGAAIGEGLAEVRRSLADIRKRMNLVRFLGAYLLYFDALVALSLFAGIYAAGVFGLSAPELALLGLVFTIATTIGAFGAGFLDDRIGGRRVLSLALVLAIISGTGIVSLSQTVVGFVIPVAAPLPGRGAFSAPAGQVFLVLAFLIGLASGAIQGASRSVMARLTPVARATEFFGFFAFAGRATIFVGPLLIGIATSLTGSQRAGISVVLFMMALGLMLLHTVRMAPADD